MHKIYCKLIFKNIVYKTWRICNTYFILYICRISRRKV